MFNIQLCIPICHCTACALLAVAKIRTSYNAPRAKACGERSCFRRTTPPALCPQSSRWWPVWCRRAAAWAPRLSLPQRCSLLCKSKSVPKQRITSSHSVYDNLEIISEQCEHVARGVPSERGQANVLTLGSRVHCFARHSRRRTDGVVTTHILLSFLLFTSDIQQTVSTYPPDVISSPCSVCAPVKQ